MKCLSVRQPWAWAILHKGKDVENRTWPTNVRGRIAIHAGKAFDFSPKQFPDEAADWAANGFDWASAPRGAIIGTVEIVNCARAVSTGSDWASTDPDHWGFVLRNPIALATPIPWRGELGFFDVPDQLIEVGK